MTGPGPAPGPSWPRHSGVRARHNGRQWFLPGSLRWRLIRILSRHKSLDTLRGYVRRVDLFKEHAGAAFL